MNIAIVGWYGTDTLGDRAILDGIFEIIKEIDPKCNIFIGSLFLFYSERTLLEEKSVFSETAPFFNIKLFDLKDRKILNETVKKMDAVIMGGGPLMDIEELFLIERCFDIAKKFNIPRIIMGCGVGPLENSSYRKSVGNILLAASAIYLRDELSIEYIKSIYCIKKPLYYIGDPAIVSIEKYKSEPKTSELRNVAINFRDYPRAAYSAVSIVTDNNFAELINICAEKFDCVLLVPMHTFYIGGDDREYLSQLKEVAGNKNIEVLHKPMNLHELYSVFSESYACIGMRYHSVVMQTILNGNNLILNYTDEHNGKISGFLKSLKTSFYADRVINLQSISEWKIENKIDRLSENMRFHYNESTIKETYIDHLKNDLGW